jgi:hypothetical protein
MKKYIILALVILAIIAAGWGIYEFFQYKNTTFTLSSDVTKVDVYVEDENVEEKKLAGTATKSNPTIKLRVGSYEYVPEGNKIAKDTKQFSVKNDSTVTVDPDYSETYLDSIAIAELPALAAALSDKYPEQMKQFTANNTKLFGKGSWAGILLTPVGMDPQSPGGYYRVLAEKKSGTWSLIGKPEIVLTKYNTPNVPIEMLTSVNSIALR